MAIKLATKKVTAKKVVKKTGAAPAEKQVRKPISEIEPNSVEAKLRALYDLQQIDSQIDKIRIVRGELPIEVRDLEDEVAGLETRVQNYQDELKKLEELVSKRKHEIKDAQALIKKYETQQNNVKNNREYESLTKELEFQNLEIQLAEKRTREHLAEIESKKAVVEASEEALKERKKDLDVKKAELDSIIAETEKEEKALLKKLQEDAKIIDERLLIAYKRIKSNARNGLAVVTVQRDACGGCFNKVPPQRQLDIRQHKKVTVCEHCGRILVDAIFGEI